jgi:glycosyltransferase involved in cell wall biosynthesis
MRMKGLDTGLRKVLVIAFHFPPQVGSSGLLRSLKFCRYLPEFGWVPTVLSAHLRAYESVDPRGNALIGPEITVLRPQAWDTKRHLGFRGRYVGWMALPDRWVSWLVGGIPAGLRAIWGKRIEVVFSTFPIPSAILLGFILHRLTGRPWVVDFRDSMTEEGYPRDPRAHRVSLWIEKKVVQYAARIIFTAESTRRMYLQRYSGLAPERCVLISNGFDEEDFVSINTEASSVASEPLRLLHTGLVYPEERDPRPFFRALARLKREGRISPGNLNIVFRASGSESLYQTLIDELSISDILHLKPHVPYQQVLKECSDASALLLFQAANCDHQIPAKAYEYLRLRKPILALTSDSGDTAALLREVGGATIADIANEQHIYEKLPIFLQRLRDRSHPLPDAHRIQRYARRNQAGQLSKCLSETLYLDRSMTPQRMENVAR